MPLGLKYLILFSSLADKNILEVFVIFFAKWIFLIIPKTFFKVYCKDAVITVIARKDIDTVIYILLFNLLKSHFIKFG